MTRGLFVYSRRIALSDLATGLPAGVGMYALTVALARVHLPAIDVENDGVATVAQVIPATIVAVFVFILGLGFLMAQLVAPARGSRAVTKLHESRRLRAIVIVGLVLLVASLLLGTASPASHWRLGLATALIVATVLYWVGTTCAMAVLLRETIDPKRFSDKIVTGAATTINRHFGNPQFVAEDLYERLRIFRGWLRTVNRIGESRDLQYAIIGTRALVAEYIKTLDRPPDGNDKLHHVGRSTPRLADRDSMDPMLRDAERRGDTDGRTTPWFADELGRALVRAVESGISGNTLRRDLHRLLALFEACIEDFATVPNSAGMAEARALLTKLVEVGLGAHQVPNDARAWFVAPAVRLATLYRFFADGPTLDTPPGPADVQASQEALAGWLIVTDAVFPDPCSADCEAEFEAYLATCAPYLQDFAEHLPGARRRIRGKDLEPEWDVVVGCRARHADQIATILRARLPQPGHLEGVDDQLCAEMVGD